MSVEVIHSKGSRLYIILGGFFIANALIAEFMGVKIFSLEQSLGLKPVDLVLFSNHLSFNLTAGVLLWPVVFVMTDIINEYYGVKGVRFLSNITVILVSYAFLAFYAAIRLTPAGFWPGSKAGAGVPDLNLAYSAIFGQGLWIIIGSLVAFLIGQLVDVVIFHKIKQVTGEKWMWLRSTGSTVVSQFIDSFVVLFIAFYVGTRIGNNGGTPWPLMLVISIGFVNYIYKFTMAIVLTPVIYLVHRIVENYLGHDLAGKMKEKALAGG